MLTKKQIKEIREHLNRSQNPLFFFDNDVDGLCSFLLLQRYLGRGRGIPIKSFPELTIDYFRKINELGADYAFILDKPVVSKEFFAEIEKNNIPTIWIDHHDIDKKSIPKFVNYYNPLFNRSKKNEPTTFLCYQVSQKKEDLWIAILGCISDKFIPKFYNKFLKECPDISLKTKNAFDIFYNSETGKIAKILSFALKDRTTNVINMLKFLIKAKSPYEILSENSKNYQMHKRFNQINKKYQKLIEKARNLGKKSNEVLFFQYSGDLSISSDLSNELSYNFPNKIIAVVYVKEAKVNASIRGKGARNIVLKSIKDLERASGGGHEDAAGAQIKTADLEKFRDNIKKFANR